MHLQEEPSRLSAILESADDGTCEWFGGIAGSLCSKGAGFNSDDAPAGSALAALSGLARVGSFGCEEVASVLRKKQHPTSQTGTDGASHFAGWNACAHGARGCETYSWPSSR